MNKNSDIKEMEIPYQHEYEEINLVDELTKIEDE